MQEKADVLQLEMLSWYLVELCLTEYSMVKFCPSQVAAAAVYMALNILVRETCCWGPALQLHSGYTESQLKYVISSLSSHFSEFYCFLGCSAMFSLSPLFPVHEQNSPHNTLCCLLQGVCNND